MVACYITISSCECRESRNPHSLGRRCSQTLFSNTRQQRTCLDGSYKNALVVRVQPMDTKAAHDITPDTLLNNNFLHRARIPAARTPTHTSPFPHRRSGNNVGHRRHQIPSYSTSLSMLRQLRRFLLRWPSETARWLSWDRSGYRLYSRVSSMNRAYGIAVA